MSTRFTACLVLGAWLHLYLPCAGQAQSAQQVVGANPANRDEKKPAPVADEVKPADSKKIGSAVVRHLEAKQNGFKVAETAHFRILHDQPKPIVDKVGEVAENTRTLLQRKWFGDVATDLDGKCSIYLAADHKAYTKGTKLKNTVGHMRTFGIGEVSMRSIHVSCEDPSQVADVLPHEVSHSVMAARFQGRAPRWADEGMAMLAESPASVMDCIRRLPRYKKNEGLFSLEILMQTTEADHYNTMEYYAQATSLVQFLTSEKGPQTFTLFLRTYINKGIEPALEQHYAIDGYAELEKRWQAFAFGKRK